MKKALVIKIAALLVLSIISVWASWPMQENLVKGDSLNADNKTVNFSVASPKFQSFLQQIGLPINIKIGSYDLFLSNLNNKYDISYVLSFDKNDPILPYLEKEIGPAKSAPSIDGHPSFEIRANESPKIKNIPIDIVFSQRFGSFSLCESGLINKKGLVSDCGDLGANEEYFNLSKKNFQAIAVPNISIVSLSIQLILILVFWVVIINNVQGFFKK